jgi:hypothetical protein
VLVLLWWSFCALAEVDDHSDRSWLLIVAAATCLAWDAGMLVWVNP